MSISGWLRSQVTARRGRIHYGHTSDRVFDTLAGLVAQRPFSPVQLT
jgi:adenylosuccinate lyase